MDKPPHLASCWTISCSPDVPKYSLLCLNISVAFFCSFWLVFPLGCFRRPVITCDYKQWDGECVSKPCVAFQWPLLHSVTSQFSSVAQSCLTLCSPMNRSTPGLPVHHQLPEFIQTHVHQVSDAIQPSHPRSSPSPPAPNPSQHKSLFQ